MTRRQRASSSIRNSMSGRCLWLLTSSKVEWKINSDLTKSNYIPSVHDPSGHPWSMKMYFRSKPQQQPLLFYAFSGSLSSSSQLSCSSRAHLPRNRMPWNDSNSSRSFSTVSAGAFQKNLSPPSTHQRVSAPQDRASAPNSSACSDAGDRTDGSLICPNGCLAKKDINDALFNFCLIVQVIYFIIPSNRSKKSGDTCKLSLAYSN